MAVISAVETRRGGNVDDKNFRNYYREWLLRTDNAQDGPLLVSAHLGLVLWSSYYNAPGESDIYAKCKTINVDPLPGELQAWILKATYDNKPYDTNSIANGTASPSASPGNATPQPPGGTDPATRNWSISFGAKQTEQHAYEDVNGQAAAASNGQPFEGGISYNVATPYFTLTTYSFAANFQKVGQYVNTLNNAMWQGFNTGTLRCVDYKIESQWEDQWGRFYKKDITCEINNDGWDVQVLNAGTHKHETATGWTPFVDAFGKDVTSPVPLSLATGLPLVPPAPPEYKSFQMYRLRNFNLIF